MLISKVARSIILTLYLLLKILNTCFCFKMGIKTFEIKLSTPTDHVYHPGDTIQGHVTFAKDSPEKDASEDITLTLYGQGFAQWTERAGDSSVTYTGEDKLFTVACTMPTASHQTEYPFLMQIPDIPALPWTINTSYGHIKYGILATIKRPWYYIGKKKAKLEFRLQSEIHPSLVAKSKDQRYFSEINASGSATSKTNSCCFPLCCWYYFGTEKVEISLRTERLWVCPGDNLEFTLEVDNNCSEREVKSIKVDLVGNVVHISDGGRSKGETHVLWEELFPVQVGSGLAEKRQGKAQVASDLFPTHVECKVIRMTYKLRARLQVNGFRCCDMNSMAEVDVVIGSNPVPSTIF